MRKEIELERKIIYAEADKKWLKYLYFKIKLFFIKRRNNI